MDISHLNEQQQKAVIDSYDKDTLLLAGPGSGKTSVITHRVGYIIEELQVDPSQLMLLTFTNKAATEMKERIEKLNINTQGLWAGTFHSICVRILKKFGSDIGLSDFTIIDTSDTKKVMSEAMANLLVDVDKYTVKHYLSRVSSHKNNFISPTDLLQRASEEKDVNQRQEALVYKEYQNMCWSRKYLDFDDILIYTIVLLQKSLRTQQWFHQNIKYLLCDESQDSNECQIMILQLLKGPDTNVFCVGDPDQSIYGFRNAKPKSFIDFDKIFPNSKVLRLERNYRSTKKIVQASNDVIQNNSQRLKKTVFTNNPEGERVTFKISPTGEDEALYIGKEIKHLHDYKGKDYKDFAVLYRTNSQSRSIEDVMLKLGIPYHITGNVGFYNRYEIKDLMAYLRLKNNPKDEIAFSRVLMSQKGLGAKTAAEIISSARANNLTFVDILPMVTQPKKIIPSLRNIEDMLNFDDSNIFLFLENVVKQSEIIEKYTSEGTDEAYGRIENINELLTIAKEHQNMTLEDFVEMIALSSKETALDNPDSVSLMTIHSAKGLEFDTVFVAGVEENILPHVNSKGNQRSLEEERRLMYVAMTRAKKDLYLTASKTRTTYNSVSRNAVSRFVEEISKFHILTIL